MEKQDVLAEIERLAATRAVSFEEVTQAFTSGSLTSVHTRLPEPISRESDHSHLREPITATDILLFIGGGIICIGIALLIGMEWELLGNFDKIIVTVGPAISSFIIALLVNKHARFAKLATALFFISAILVPIATFTTLHVNGFAYDNISQINIVLFFLFSFYLASYYFTRQAIFILFSLFSGTTLFYSTTTDLFTGTGTFEKDFWLYRSMLVSVVYFGIGQYFQHSKVPELKGLLQSIGAFGFLSAALGLTSGDTFMATIWEFLFPILALGTIFLSVELKSRGLLLWGSLFLTIDIFKLTGQYFSDTLGWPVSLIIAGLCMMGIGYYALSLSKTYLNKSPVSPPPTP